MCEEEILKQTAIKNALKDYARAAEFEVESLDADARLNEIADMAIANLYVLRRKSDYPGGVYPVVSRADLEDQIDDLKDRLRIARGID